MDQSKQKPWPTKKMRNASAYQLGFWRLPAFLLDESPRKDRSLPTSMSCDQLPMGLGYSLCLVRLIQLSNITRTSEVFFSGCLTNFISHWYQAISWWYLVPWIHGLSDLANFSHTHKSKKCSALPSAGYLEKKQIQRIPNWATAVQSCISN